MGTSPKGLQAGNYVYKEDICLGMREGWGKDTVQNWLEEGREGRNRCFQSQGLARNARGEHGEGRGPDVFSICN